MTTIQRIAQFLMAAFGLLTIIFYASVYAATGDEAFPNEANGLIASAGAALGVLVILLATAGLNSGERWAWLGLWTLPAFFIAHAALLGIWLPDGIFAAVSVGALVVTKPRYASA
jgi:hypothetical protein